jgi:hypothetical protein
VKPETGKKWLIGGRASRSEPGRFMHELLVALKSLGMVRV